MDSFSGRRGNVLKPAAWNNKIPEYGFVAIIGSRGVKASAEETDILGSSQNPLISGRIPHGTAEGAAARKHSLPTVYFHCIIAVSFPYEKARRGLPVKAQRIRTSPKAISVRAAATCRGIEGPRISR